MRRTSCHSLPGRRAGLTLLEVLLALGILAATMMAVSPVVETGLSAAVRAEREAEALVIARRRMNEVECCLTPMAPSGRQSCSENPALEWEISVASTDEAGLARVSIAVRSAATTELAPVEVLLVRLMRRRESSDPSSSFRGGSR